MEAMGYSHASSLLEKCIATKNLNLGKLLHSHLIKTALRLDVFLANRLIHLYAVCGSASSARKMFEDLPMKNDHSYNTLISSFTRLGLFGYARNLFVAMPQPTLVAYNSMISGLVHYGRHGEAVGVFYKMQKEFDGPVMDRFTVVGVANACAHVKSIRWLRQVHSVVVMMDGLELNLVMYNALLDAYGKCGDVDSSRKLFDRMPERDIVSWTSLVVAYSWVHRMEEACQVFDRMPLHNAVSWTALITGFAQNEQGDKAIKIFRKMQAESVPSNDFTYVGVLSACASLASIDLGRQVHSRILRSCTTQHTPFNVFIYNALVDMYAKCGDMKSASALFEEMPERDRISWNSMVTGFAQNGDGRHSLAHFEGMIEAGVSPNHVTFLGVLSGCSHAGLVLEGYQLLTSMQKEYGVRPSSEHYAILIDALGRKNRLEEAIALIEQADCNIDKVGMWGALLGACHIHSRLDIARKAAESLFDVEPGNAARYVTLSNIYAAAGRWKDMRGVWGLMKEKGLRKEQACSWIEVRR